MENKTRMTKKRRALAIMERLKEEYPVAECTLDTKEAWKLLVSVRLAAQCTDARVNIIVKDLFAKYPSALDRNRTSDTRIFSPLLYQLSYQGLSYRNCEYLKL